MAKAEKDNVIPLVRPQRNFANLPFAEKKAYLQTVDVKRRLDLIVSDPEAKRLVASLQPQEFFRLVKEVGENDALELLELATGEQSVFLLDMELWEGWSFSEDEAHRWLTYLMEGGEAHLHELLKKLDFEWLLLFLSRELVVRGGIGDLAHDEEKHAECDFTFDDVFYLTFKKPEHSQLVGAFLKMLIKLDQPLYVSLMEEIKGSVDVELEEDCLRFRSGRLQDLGFPPLEEALALYGRVDPRSFRLQGDKEELHPTSAGELVPLSVQRESLLSRALEHAGSEVLMQEVNYLVNCALVAEGTALGEFETATAVMERVGGYLNIALEFLAKGDELEAARIVKTERLQRLFSLGFSLVLQVAGAAFGIETTDYPSGKVLAGLRAKHPRFYRGLDPDGIDGFREFRDGEDLKTAARFLSDLRG